MECPEENVLLDFIRAELDDETRQEVEVHIDQCATCGQVLAELARFERDSEGYVEPTLGAEEEEEEDDDDDDDEPSPTPRFRGILLKQGSTLGRYVVLDQIGSGGMGVVYSAYDPRLDRRIALKLLMGSPGGSLPKEYEELRTRMQREAQAMARLNHPNVITVHDVGEVDGQLFLAMEFVDGGTLKDWMRKGPHPWPDALNMFIAAGSGLAAAHAAGLVHRDFKPDNVLLGTDGRVLVTDFGLARPTAGRTDAFLSVPAAEKMPVMSAQLTMTGELVGTPAYMAPEQLAGKRSDALGDQFSFCVALYEALYGDRPFAGKLLGELIANVSSGTVRTTKRDSQVPRRIRKVVLRGLESSAEDRYADMHELLAKLRGDPGRRWRATAAIAVPAVLLSIGVGAYISDDREAVAYCDDLDLHFAGIWDRQGKSTLESAFRHSGESYAEDSFKATARHLDGYANRWQELQSDACRAEVDGTIPAPVLALRMSCLEQHRQRFDALVEVLQGGERPVLERAVDAAAQLPDPAECLDVQRVSTELAGLETERARRTRKELETDLGRAYALGRTAKYEEAESLASDVAGRARQSKDVWVEAEATALRAEFEERLGRADEAESRYDVAFSRAIASNHAEVMVQVAIGKMWLRAHPRGDPKAVQHWLSIGESALVHLGEDPVHKSRLFSAAGRALTLQQQHSLAESHLRRALSEGEKAFGVNHPALAEPLSAFGELLARQSLHVRAQPIFERVLELAQREFGNDHPNVASASENLGSTLARRDELDDALRYFRRALEIKERQLPSGHPRVALTHRNIARALYRLGRIEEARPHAEAALVVADDAQSTQATHRVAALEVMVDVLRALGEAGEAVNHAREAEQLARASYGDSDPEYGRVARLLATALTDAGDPEAAMAPAQRAVTIARASEGVPAHERAWALTALAAAQVAAGRPPTEAIALGTEAVKTLSAAKHPEDRIALAEAQLALAGALAMTGEAPERVRELATRAREAFGAAGRGRDARRAGSVLDSVPPA